MTPVALLVILAVLLIGNGLFLLTVIGSAPLAWGLLLMICAGAGLALRQPRPFDLSEWKSYGACAALALLICVLGGQGHLVFANEDWLIRDAVLGDLIRRPWPVTYAMAGGPEFLRAPVGFYMLPADVGRLFGVGAAYVAMVLQNTVLLGAILALLTASAAKARDKALLLGVFFTFSGFDVLGECLRVAIVHSAGHPIPFPLHMEHWSGLEYSSFITDLFWAPNHSLPALAFAAAYLSWRRGEIATPALALVLGASVLWSPLAVIGAMPFMLLAVIRDWRVLVVHEIVGVVLVGAALLPVAVYLSLASANAPHGWTLAEWQFRLFAPLFYLFEVFPMLALVLLGSRDEPRPGRIELAVIVGLILALPIYRIGVSNDFMMRASIPALALAAMIVAERMAFRVAHRRWRAMWPALAALAIGAFTPAFQIARIFVHPATPISDDDLPRAWAHSKYGEASLDTYAAPASTLAPWRWMLGGRAPEHATPKAGD